MNAEQIQKTKAEWLKLYSELTEGLNKRFAETKDPKALKDALDATAYYVDNLKEMQEGDKDLKEALAKDDQDFAPKQAAFTALVAGKEADYKKITGQVYKREPRNPDEIIGKNAGEPLHEGGNKAGDAVNGFFKSIKETAGKVVDSVKNFFSSDKKKKKDGSTAADGEQSGVNVGDLVGGLGGAILGWLLGGMFGGGGVMGTVVGIGLALGGFFMGKKAFGDTINGWMGHAPSTPNVAKADQPNVQQTQQQAVSPTAAAPAQNQNTAKVQDKHWTQEELQSLVKGNIAKKCADAGIAYDPNQPFLNNEQYNCIHSNVTLARNNQPMPGQMNRNGS